jgi:YesN/AraC family two-component response regulator
MEVLTDYGYRVLEAGSGSDALALTCSYGVSIHVLVTDVRMPGMEGPELAAAAKNVVPSLKILYMSGYTDHPILRGDLTEAVADYIQKPFAGEDLCARIASLLKT